jgi:hypothetical protein
VGLARSPGTAWRPRAARLSARLTSLLDVERSEPGPAEAGEPEEFDGPAEVAAAAATQRRVALGYAGVFLLGILAVPVLTVTLPWWSEARLLGGMSPSFLVAALGLYGFFLALGIAAAGLARSVEDRMLGGPSSPGDPDP